MNYYFKFKIFQLQTHHPEYYECLLSAWRKFYPESVVSSGTQGDAPYVPPSISTGSIQNPVKSATKFSQLSSSSSSSSKPKKSGGYSSLPTAEDEDEEGHDIESKSNKNSTSINDIDSDEEESIQLNNLPLSLSQIMNISKNAVTNVMEAAVQGGNTINEFIQTNTNIITQQQQQQQNSQSREKIIRTGTYGQSNKSKGNNNQRNTIPEDSFENSML